MATRVEVEGAASSMMTGEEPAGQSTVEQEWQPGWSSWWQSFWNEDDPAATTGTARPGQSYQTAALTND